MNDIRYLDRLLDANILKLTDKLNNIPFEPDLEKNFMISLFDLKTYTKMMTPRCFYLFNCPISLPSMVEEKGLHWRQNFIRQKIQTHVRHCQKCIWVKNIFFRLTRPIIFIDSSRYRSSTENIYRDIHFFLCGWGTELTLSNAAYFYSKKLNRNSVKIYFRYIFRRMYLLDRISFLMIKHGYETDWLQKCDFLKNDLDEGDILELVDFTMEPTETITKDEVQSLIDWSKQQQEYEISHISRHELFIKRDGEDLYVNYERCKIKIKINDKEKCYETRGPGKKSDERENESLLLKERQEKKRVLEDLRSHNDVKVIPSVRHLVSSKGGSDFFFMYIQNVQ
tara:strand:+ start:1431 stop:2444 length:1014 start_codon:yes stop_codon:yes gene_type:complete